MMEFDTTTPIGFIGLGVMGSAMAARLIDAGYAVTLHNRSMRLAEPLASRVASAVAAPVEVAWRSRLVFLSLPETEDVEAVLFGEQGLAAGLARGSCVIDTSTISAAAARDFAQRLQAGGIDMLDAPVSGGRQGALQGSLTCMAGGPEAVFEACRVPVSAIAARYLRMGGHGAGQIAKACNQVAVAGAVLGVAEALVLAARQGLDPATVREALLGGAARSFALEKHGQRMIDHDFAPGFTAALMRKDLGLASQAGRDSETFLPGANIMLELLDALSATGSGDLDWSAVATMIERLSGGDTP
jgi:2-hydroxy-3-oxopropionate reductase